MRNKRTIVGLVAVLISALVASIAWAAPGDTVQTIKGTVAPNKLPKNTFKPAAIKVVTTTGVEGENGEVDESERPPPAERAVLTFDKDVKFDTRGVPKCTENLNGTSTEQAKAACGSSQVSIDGPDNSSAVIGLGDGNTKFDAVVTAFNGPTEGGKPTLLLHSRVDALATTSILVGTLKKPAKNFKLDVAIPEIANGQGSVLKFQAKVKKGKYVQAKCPDRKLPLKGTFFYENGTSKSASSNQACKAGR